MGELRNFLVWMTQKKKAGEIPHKAIEVVGYWAIKYMEEQNLEDL